MDPDFHNYDTKNLIYFDLISISFCRTYLKNNKN